MSQKDIVEGLLMVALVAVIAYARIVGMKEDRRLLKPPPKRKHF